MRKQTSLTVVMSMLVLVALPALGQIQNVQPRVDQKETSPDMYLSHNYIAFDGTVRGKLVYAGGNPAGQHWFGFQNNTGDYLSFMSTTFIQFAFLSGPVANEQMRIDNNGVTVGVNPAATAVKLTVNGALDVKGNIAAKYQDVAEWVPATGAPQPGTVVVLDGDAVNHVIASDTPYDTRVAGVVSDKPGVILGEASADKVMVSTTGRVHVKVDATASPIKIGDLLVTSDVAGVAMKSTPIDVGGLKIHRPGTIIGKALEPLDKGTGEILVLLALQ